MSDQAPPNDDGVLQEDWNSYIGFVDDAPAAILLNLGLEAAAPIKSLPVLHFWSVDMGDPGPHGLGTAEEAAAFEPIEDMVTEPAAKLGLLNVGRLRNHGYWQLTYYGAEDIIEQLGSLAHEALSEQQRASLKIGTDDDPDWGYYLNFLCPSPQQRQWMSDRSVVQLFMEHGDPLTPRPVDHFAYFEGEPEARAFASMTSEQGFACQINEPGVGEDGVEQPLWGVQATREDAVDLSHIHGVVMTLVTIAEEIGGRYDGWGAPSVAPAGAGAGEQE